MDSKQILYFTAPWCVPCRTFGPRLTTVSDDLGIPVVKINVEEQPDMASEFEVMSLPTIIVMKDGHVGGYHVGAKTEQQLRSIFAA